MSVELKVSVVVSVFNGCKNVGGKIMRNCLNSLLNLNYGNYEIILINDGSTDNTDRVFEGYKEKVVYVKNRANLGLAASRNRGIRLAIGEYVAFTDIDCVVDEDWLKTLVQCLVKNKAQGAGGSVKTPQDVGYFSRCVGILHKPSPKLISRNEAEVPGCNAIFKKSLLLKMNGFDETFKESNADTDFNVRVWSRGIKIYYEPAAIVYHYHRSNLPSFVKWRFINGIGLYRLARKHLFKAKRMYHLFNLGLPPFLIFMGILGVLTKPIFLPILLLVLYVVQAGRLFMKEHGEFSLCEILGGVFLGWALRLSGSIGFWYAMITLSRRVKRINLDQPSPVTLMKQDEIQE